MNYKFNNVSRLKQELLQLNNKSILITGCNGFLGRYFASILEKSNCKLYLMDNGIVPNSDCNSKYYKIDICDKEKVLSFEEPLDYIINCAGIASPYWYNKLQMETLNVSVDGLKNILELSIKHNKTRKPARVLYFSSSEIYGTPDICPTPETYIGKIPTMTNRSAYDIGKLIGNTLCYIYNQEKGADAVICAPFNFCGNFSQNDGRVLPNFINKILKDEPVEIYGSGEQTRTFCHITDAIVGSLKILVNGKKGELYNIGNPDGETSMNNLVKVIEKVIGKEVKVNHLPAPINYETEPLRRCPDIAKAKTQLGYEPQVSLEEIIKDFYDWAKENYDYPNRKN